jgi:hypothetical protein
MTRDPGDGRNTAHALLRKRGREEGKGGWGRARGCTYLIIAVNFYRCSVPVQLQAARVKRWAMPDLL